MCQFFISIDDCSKHLIDNLESHVVSGKEAVVKDVFGCLTMDVIAKCTFGTDTNANQDKNNPFVINGRKVFQVNVLRALIQNFVPKFVLRLIKFKGYRANGEANKFFINMASHIVKNR